MKTEPVLIDGVLYNWTTNGTKTKLTKCAPEYQPKEKKEQVKPMETYIKEWFYNKSIASTCWDGHYCEVVRETEKAYYVHVIINGSIWCRHWVPKSCCETREEHFEAVETSEKRSQERWEAGCKAYKELVAYAQKMGVKGVHEGLRKDTILRKMEVAGVELPA